MKATSLKLNSSKRLWPARFCSLRLGREAFSTCLDLRAGLVSLIFFTLALGVMIYSLSVGELKISWSEVWNALGRSSSTSGATLVILEWRLPRVLLAFFAGAALALAGALFQSLTKNPLGSPDIIGFNTGAYTGVVVVSLILGGGYVAMNLGALLGGVITAILVYFLAFGSGVSGLRLVVVGIGLNAMLTAFNIYLLTVVNAESARSVSIWGVGSLSTTTWPDLLPVVVATLGLLPICMLLARRMRLLEMGDDVARSLGVRAELTRVWLVVLGVGLTAVVTAAAGPISFVALACPQIARRLVGGENVPILPSAIMGAFLLSLADLVAKTVIAPAELPVGVVTVVVGGAYLFWLLLPRKAR